MVTNWILMTALPPTLGHLDMIRFAANLGGNVRVLLVNKPNEPYTSERLESLRQACQNMLNVSIEQFLCLDETGETNEWWANQLETLGFRAEDRIVASEDWGVELSTILKADFFPYDISREMRFTKATLVRENYRNRWDWILPEFKTYLAKRVVIFGAESVGKTTTAKALARNLMGNFIPEYARPYLETLGAELDVKKMQAIHYGQRALQRNARETLDPAVWQLFDTDLFSTLGYWRFWSPESMPEDLENDSIDLSGDYYFLLPSNIPMEEDPLRYAGDQREQTDDYWLNILEEFDLPYSIVDTPAPWELSKDEDMGKRVSIELRIDFMVSKLMDEFSQFIDYERLD